MLIKVYSSFLFSQFIVAASTLLTTLNSPPSENCQSLSTISIPVQPPLASYNLYFIEFLTNCTLVYQVYFSSIIGSISVHIVEHVCVCVCVCAHTHTMHHVCKLFCVQCVCVVVCACMCIMIVMIVLKICTSVPCIYSHIHITHDHVAKLLSM